MLAVRAAAPTFSLAKSELAWQESIPVTPNAAPSVTWRTAIGG
jgi:hypothetical protein